MDKKSLRVAIVGAGWSGLAAAVAATQAGHQITVFEAARTPGGRARAVSTSLPDGSPVTIDNGQHILIGAYRETLALMRTVGVVPETALHRAPLTLCQPDGHGISLPAWPSPLDALAGIWTAKGWAMSDCFAMTRAALRWQFHKFKCAETTTVASLCSGLPPAVMQSFIEPLCVSALNTPAERASGQVFLTVLRDAMFGEKGSSNLLIPRTDLSALFPRAASEWLHSRGAAVQVGHRVPEIQHDAFARSADGRTGVWRVGDQTFDRVILAAGPTETARLLERYMAGHPQHSALHRWIALARNIQFESIATVYTLAHGAILPKPMLSLRSDADNPAQFVFDRGQLGGPPGLWAWVVSASAGSRQELQEKVLQQAMRQVSSDCFMQLVKRSPRDTRPVGLLPGQIPVPLVTIVEKKATFACTPGLIRPDHDLGEGLLACGDYLYAAYPATLEGAVRSGQVAAEML